MVWIRKRREPRDSEITPYDTWLNRRHFIDRSAKAAASAEIVPVALDESGRNDVPIHSGWGPSQDLRSVATACSPGTTTGV